MSSKATALSGRRESSMITPASSPTEPCALSLPAQVAELRTEVAALRDSFAVEVRTRRIVVVDQDGTERIYSTISGNYASFDVRSAIDGFPASLDNEAVCSIESSFDGNCGVSAMVGGNVVASMTSTSLEDDVSLGHRANGSVMLCEHSWKNDGTTHVETNHAARRRLDIEHDSVDQFVAGHRVASAVFQVPATGGAR